MCLCVFGIGFVVMCPLRMESGLQGLGVGFSECSPATALNTTVRLGTGIAFSSHRQQSP